LKSAFDEPGFLPNEASFQVKLFEKRKNAQFETWKVKFRVKGFTIMKTIE
jgi:hypothetical protein